MEKSNSRFEITAKIIFYALPILGIFGMIIPSVVGQLNLTLLGSYIAVPLIIAPIIHNKIANKKLNLIELNNKVFILFLIAFFVCISLSIITLYINSYRPILYYVIITVMSLLILFEIMLFKDSNIKTKIILFQLMTLLLCILWSVNLNYFYYISRTDPIFHITAIESLINSTYINEEVFGIYKPFPLWHLLCTIVHHISALNLPTQKTMFFINGIIYSFIPIVTYLISNKLFNNSKLSLISALFICINTDVISYGLSSISRSVVSFLFLLLLLILLHKSNIKMLLLSIILIFPITMYHTASTPFILVILLLLSLGNYIYRVNGNIKFLNYNYIGLFVLINIFYWMFYAELMFETIITSIIREAPSGVLTSSIIYTPLNELFNYIHYTPLLFFMIVGTLAVLHSSSASPKGKVFCLIGLMAVAVAFPGPILLINKLTGDLNVGRFGQYLYPFISLTASVGFFTIFNNTKKYQKFIVLILFTSLVFLSVSNDFVASDNPLIERPFYTFYLTEQEIYSFNTVSAFSTGSIMSDYVTSRYFLLTNSSQNDKSHILEIDSTNMRLLREKENDIFLLRFSELSKRPLKLYTNTDGQFKLNPSWERGAKLDYYYDDLNLWGEMEVYNKIYDTKGVQAFI